MTDLIKVMVCTFEPQHTLSRATKQRQAAQDGTLAKLKKRLEEQGAELEDALDRLGILTMKRRANHDIVCAECGMVMEEVYASEGITDRMEAIVDVCNDFGEAIRRTRDLRR